MNIIMLCDFNLKTKRLYTMKTNIILCESTQVKNDAYLTLNIYGGLPPSLTCLSGIRAMRLAANLYRRFKSYLRLTGKIKYGFDSFVQSFRWLHIFGRVA